jgi:DNA ligase-1
MMCATLKDPDQLQYPYLATPKLDGIRCVKVLGRALTRSFKLIQNDYIRETIEAALPDGVDGEIVIPGASYNDVQSAVMRRDGAPHQFQFVAFDMMTDPFVPYSLRVKDLPSGDFVRKLLPTLVESADELRKYIDLQLSLGYEGAVVRSPMSPYKFGRSTNTEAYMFKWKPYRDAEATVLEIHEKETNLNPQVPDAFGYAKRPGGQQGKAPVGTMGSLTVRDTVTGVEFNVGSGFDDAERKRVWDNQQATLGRVLTYTYQGEGVKTKPRFPRFKHWRAEE